MKAKTLHFFYAKELKIVQNQEKKPLVYPEFCVFSDFLSLYNRENSINVSEIKNKRIMILCAKGQKTLRQTMIQRKGHMVIQR